MFKSTAQADQFHTRSGNESTKGSRKGFSLLGGGVDPASVLDATQQRASERTALVSELAKLQKEASQAKITMKRHLKRPEFFAAKEHHETCTVRITEIMEKLRSTKLRGTLDAAAVQDHFLDVAREMLTGAQFKIIMSEASERARKGLPRGRGSK